MTGTPSSRVAGSDEGGGDSCGQMVHPLETSVGSGLAARGESLGGRLAKIRQVRCVSNCLAAQLQGRCKRRVARSMPLLPRPVQADAGELVGRRGAAAVNRDQQYLRTVPDHTHGSRRTTTIRLEAFHLPPSGFRLVRPGRSRGAIGRPRRSRPGWCRRRPAARRALRGRRRPRGRGFRGPRGRTPRCYRRGAGRRGRHG